MKKKFLKPQARLLENPGASLLAASIEPTLPGENENLHKGASFGS